MLSAFVDYKVLIITNKVLIISIDLLFSIDHFYLPDLSIFNLLSVFVLVQRFLNYYPNYPTYRLYLEKSKHLVDPRLEQQPQSNLLGVYLHHGNPLEPLEIPSTTSTIVLKDALNRCH